MLDATPNADDYEMGEIAKCLANNRQGNASKEVFNILATVANNRSEDAYTRAEAIEAWGKLGDPRSVVQLLNITGLDAYGEDLLVDPEAPKFAVKIAHQLMLEGAASGALGGMVFAQEREGIYTAE